MSTPDLESLKIEQKAKGVPFGLWPKMTKNDCFLWPPQAAENFQVFRAVSSQKQLEEKQAFHVFGEMEESDLGAGYESHMSLESVSEDDSKRDEQYFL